MVLTKQELITALNNEVRILLHLASKADPSKLDFRPTPSQRSTLDLLQYLTIMAPIHLRAVLAPVFDMDAWRREWTTGEQASKQLDLEQVQRSIGEQPALFEDLIGSCSEADLRGEIEMFGTKASRGSQLVSLVLDHYAAYRMQLFLYLKLSGREELNTWNLWAGMDPRK